MTFYYQLDGDGYLPLSDVRHILLNFSQRFTEEEVDNIIKEVDVHTDTLVDYEGKINQLLTNLKAKFIQFIF